MITRYDENDFMRKTPVDRAKRGVEGSEQRGPKAEARGPKGRGGVGFL